MASGQDAKTATRSLEFYKNKATECATKSTSALILDITKKAAIGAVLGATAGASIVGLHALNILMFPSVKNTTTLTEKLSRLMPYKWEERAVPITFTEELIKADPYRLSRCTNFASGRCSGEFYRISGAEKLWAGKPSSEWILPFETSIKTLKTVRWDYLKNNLCILGVKGAAIGALLGTGYALYKQYYASTPEWIAQLDMLQDNDFAPDPIMLGGKAYLVSQQFQDISVTNPSYELYFMPQTAQLVTVYKQIVTTLDSLSPDLKKLIACISLRLVPSTSYSGTKVLPRIVVQLYPQTTQMEGNKVLKVLHNATAAFAGDGKYPRYSQPATAGKTNLIYFAFGSGDMKDKNPGAFERKGSWMWRASDDMAYQNSVIQELSLSIVSP